MRNIPFVLILLFSQFSFAASKEKKCDYSFDIENSLVEGTGFKFTNKTGVAGKFLKFTINKNEKKNSIKDLLKGLVLTVDLMSVDSGNAIRDKNLRESFFSLFNDNSQAKVTVKKIEEKNIEADLSVHGVVKPVNFTYEVKGEKIEAKGSIDALDFAMKDAFGALKKKCGALHTGDDGKSKTWTTFKLRVEANLIKSCN